MRVIGLVYEHNATVCLIEDGAIVFCQSEERLNRIKNSAGFPTETLQYVHDHLAPPDTIDLAVVFQKTIFGYLSLKERNFVPVEGGQYLDRCARRPTLTRRFANTNPGWTLRQWRHSRTERRASLRRDAEAYFSRALRLDPGRIRYLDHHQSHAYSVVPNVWDWGQCLIFTLDAYGDGLCATVNLFDRGRLTRLSASDERHSLGRYYRDTAWLLGMKALEDEFKIMGLAPYAGGERSVRLLNRLRQLLTIDDRGQWRSASNPERLFDELERLYRYERFDDIAAAIQRLTEETIVRWVEHWITATGCRKVAVAGGVFMNVKAAQRVAEMPGLERLFVMPSAGDESCAIGSAVWGTLMLEPSMRPAPLESLYLGMAFSAGDVERAIRECQAARRYRITRPPGLPREIASLLADNKIVARCSDRMEFGARALGNRSILANPQDPLNAERLNRAIKNRDFWMPFAPSILEADLPRYVRNPKGLDASYMCLAFEATPLGRRELPAAIHPKDGTLRPHAVREAWNPGFHAVIEAFKEQTGIGAVLNTSFNLHGDPIVCSPKDAIATADRSGLEYLVLEDFLLVKTHAGEDILAHDDHRRTRTPAFA